MVGLLTPRTDLYGPTSSMIAIEVAAREAGYFVSLASVSESSAEELRTAVEHFKDQAAEAVVLIAPAREWIAAARVVAADLPVVTMCADFRSTQPKLASVSTDNESGGKARHGPPHRTRPPRHRAHRGTEDLARRQPPAGAAVAPHCAARVSPASGCSPATGAPRADTQPGCRCSPRGSRPRCSRPTTRWRSDLLRALSEAGVSVPGDVSVAGFDDVPDAAYLRPGAHDRASGIPRGSRSKCLDQLDRMLQGESGHNVRIRPRLVVRSSTAAPATATLSRPRSRPRLGLTQQASSAGQKYSIQGYVDGQCGPMIFICDRASRSIEVR